jgi:hypothetical protein
VTGLGLSCDDYREREGRKVRNKETMMERECITSQLKYTEKENTGISKICTSQT